MEPIIDHIQITVRDLEAAVPFYDRFLPLLGFRLQSKSGAVIESHDFRVVEYSHPKLSFAIFAADFVVEARFGERKRRRRDSNSRYAFTYTNFPGLLLQPLGHVSFQGL